MYGEDELLDLSGIQHFSFCPRQWGLIHIEQVWNDNLLTVQGSLMHKRAHNAPIIRDCENAEVTLLLCVGWRCIHSRLA